MQQSYMALLVSGGAFTKKVVKFESHTNDPTDDKYIVCSVYEAEEEIRFPMYRHDNWSLH